MLPHALPIDAQVDSRYFIIDLIEENFFGLHGNTSSSGKQTYKAKFRDQSF